MADDAIAPVPREDDGAWNRFVIAKLPGGVCPGIVRSIKITRQHDVDEKKGGGTKGGTLTVNGEKLATVALTLEWWQDENDDHLDLELQRCETLIALLFPGGNKAATPFDCAHPALAMHGLRSLLFEKFDGPTQTQPQIWQLSMEAKQWRPTPKAPKSATSTPAASKPLNMGNSITGGPGSDQPFGPPLPPGFTPPTPPPAPGPDKPA